MFTGATEDFAPLVVQANENEKGRIDDAREAAAAKAAAAAAAAVAANRVVNGTYWEVQESTWIIIAVSEYYQIVLFLTLLNIFFFSLQLN